ncbi:MAG TPA: GAF domain-containing protein, partial [Acidimicrobiia bacterium]|nr:GAF domain-containing protein [Acidimicrobiia bacterium]
MSAGGTSVELIAGEGLRGVLQLMAALHESGSSPERFYEAAVEAVVTTAGADRAALLLCDPDGVMRFRAWRGLSDDYRQAVEGHTPWSADDAAPILVPEAGAAPGLEEFWPAFAAEGIAALAFVPLIHRERLVGNFMLYHDKPHDFSASEIAVAEIVAGQVALALGRRRAEEAERASALRLAALQRVTAELSVAVMVDDVAAVVLGTARAELGARSASLCLLAGDDLEIAAAVGYPDEVMTHWRRFPLDGDLPASEAVRTGRAIFLRSAAERDALYPVFGSSPVVQDSAFAMVPLGDDPPVGCLVFGFPEPREFPPQDQAYLAAVAGQCASAFSRARLYEDRERSRAVAAFLAEASAALGSSLETEELASLTAEIAAGFLADWCAVFVREEGRIVPVSIAHDDAQRAAAARALLERCPVSLSDPLEALRGLDIGAALTIPLMVRDRAIGALALANQRPRPLGPDTLELAQELASRIAVALDHARSYRQQARLAQMLQANLLPPSLPEIPGLELAACHAAGSAGVDVGGDFYDV